MKSFFYYSVSAFVLIGCVNAQAAQDVQKTGRLSTRLDNAEKRLEKSTSDFEKSYNDFKTKLSNDYGISYSLDMTVMGQKGAPHGGKAAIQSIYAPTVSWEIFNNDKFGSGTIDFSYTAVRYWNNNAGRMQGKLNVANSINDFATRSNSFDQLTYTQTLFNNKLSVTMGQFPIYDFDGTQYDSNQLSNFVNDSLSQNGSQTYPVASLGAYVQFNATPDIALTAGMQDAHNTSGYHITTQTLGKKRFTTFGSISWTPTVKNMGTGQYSVMVYNQPSVPEQPKNTVGWSVNMSQNLNDLWGVFMRANGATGDSMPISYSYVLGGVLNNPFKRNPLDQAGFAVAYNKISQKYFGQTPMRKFETVFETYYSFGITQFLTITPDVQLFYHPALKTTQKTAMVYSLRAEVLF